MKTFYAFGLEISNLINENTSDEEVISFCKENGDYSVFCFEEGHTHSVSLLEAFNGWSEYVSITETLYNKLCEI
ncbi:hypothetical protein SAMN04489761_4325 [Tenacibaculum sp. MAR_2009_124]|uniref:hypothetical protein n=1 Tax=Tenacibaculum sp. MAR_2009_124 TaxID=1250059 RepID=UPI0008972D89|nr:hypothetical protein [Tenacibaculum sp. MAR_2009_124]SED11731.1 hypothetical protein SAMN04489761_4325 [Tenacibaculum sp. MAR_2009_124]